LSEFLSEGEPPPGARGEEWRRGIYDRVVDGISRGVMVAASILLVMMLGLIVLEIVLRNFFHTSTQIADEYGGYLACWLTLFGFIQVARRDRFIRVEFLLVRLSGAMREIVLIIGSLAMLIVAAVVCYAATLLVFNSYRFHAASSQYSETLMFIPQSLMPVAFFMLCLIAIEDILRRGGRLLTGSSAEARR
jgi:TRAP-type C4-dicarboxylate transport system permease small subunit